MTLVIIVCLSNLINKPEVIFFESWLPDVAQRQILLLIVRIDGFMETQNVAYKSRYCELNLCKCQVESCRLLKLLLLTDWILTGYLELAYPLLLIQHFLLKLCVVGDYLGDWHSLLQVNFAIQLRKHSEHSCAHFTDQVLHVQS
jgi:hypothetical protein